MASLKPYFLAKIDCVLRHSFSRGASSRKLKMGDFLQKWQAYSLTLWPKLTAVLRHFFSCDASSIKLKIVYLWQNGKPIALLSGQNWLFGGPFSFVVAVHEA